MASLIPPGLELTPITVVSLTASLVVSSDDSKIKSWDGQCSTPCNKNEGPFCHDKWSMVCKGMERVAMSAGFYDELTWNQWTDKMLLRMISTLFCTQTFHLLFDCLTHHTAMWLSVQQNTLLICTTNLTALITETTSFDNKTQAKISKRRILRSFFAATLHFPAHKFTS